MNNFPAPNFHLLLGDFPGASKCRAGEAAPRQRQRRGDFEPGDLPHEATEAMQERRKLGESMADGGSLVNLVINDSMDLNKGGQRWVIDG